MGIDSFSNIDGYEQVSRIDRYGPDRESEDEDEEEYAPGNRARMRQIDEYPFQTTPTSLNKTWACALFSLLFFTLGYYQLSKIESRRKHMEMLSEENEKIKSAAADKSSVGSQSIAKGHDFKKGSGSSVVVPPYDIPQYFDPFNLQSTPQQLNNHLNDWFGAPFVVTPLQLPFQDKLHGDNDNTQNKRLGYFRYPTIVNDVVVFSCEGDLYLTRLPDDIANTADMANDQVMTAMKLTTNGNAIHPKLNPKHPRFVAYTASYSGFREVYLLDLTGVLGPALRLTFTPGGITSLVGWDEDGESILYSSRSMDGNSMPDVRLFRVWLSSGSFDGEPVVKKEGDKPGNPELKDDNDNASSTSKENGRQNNNEDGNRQHQRQERLKRHLDTLSQQQAQRKSRSATSIRSIIEPVPLAQATDGFYHTIKSSTKECIYFTRASRSLWCYCPDENDDLAIPLTSDYNGTSKSPSIYEYGDEKVLLFMSDLSASGGKHNVEVEWTKSTMNLWAMNLPTSSSDITKPIRITNLACTNNGIGLSEYAIDPVTGGIVLRLGADLQFISQEEVKKRLSALFEPQTKRSWNDKLVIQLQIGVYSDFSSMQSRTIPFPTPEHLDVFDTSFDTAYVLATGRGQTFAVPVIPNTKVMTYGGDNMPARRYKVAPGTGGEGMVTILCAKYVPQPFQTASVDSGKRLALVLATDPLTPTGELAFYLIRIDHEASPSFGFASLFRGDNLDEGTDLPLPFLGGHLESGGSTKRGGLGSVYADSVTVSPCGRRAVWSDKTGRIVVITIPANAATINDETVDVVVLPSENEANQPLIVDGVNGCFTWSPGGRYLAIQHKARNQFSVISIVDVGSPEQGSIQLGRIVQATSDRYRSFSPIWGKTASDFVVEKLTKATNAGARALFFLSDRDVNLSDPFGSWSTRSTQPYPKRSSCIHVIPLEYLEDSNELDLANSFVKTVYGGGGAREVSMKGIKELESMLETKQSGDSADGDFSSLFSGGSENAIAVEGLIDFGELGEEELSFARRSYRIDSIPPAEFTRIVCQLSDDPSLVVMVKDADEQYLQTFGTSNHYGSMHEIPIPVEYARASTDNNYVIVMKSGKPKIVRRTLAGIAGFTKDADISNNIAHWSGLHLTIWPLLEYQQLFKNFWRTMRYWSLDEDPEWDNIFDRYVSLVERCAKREELEDVLQQMASELGAKIEEFPNNEDSSLQRLNHVASLGAVLERSVEKNGYIVNSLAETDPGVTLSSPLSSQALVLSGQAGLAHGDVIIGVNGEHVMNVPDINMLLLNKLAESVRLEVVRYNSTSQNQDAKKTKLNEQLNEDVSTVQADQNIVTDHLVVVPISHKSNFDLCFGAWQYKTRLSVKRLAADAGFTAGYVNLQGMSAASSREAFVRGFYPDHDKQALIIDLRNNLAFRNYLGDADFGSWILDALQHNTWMYRQSRTKNDFSFNGHVIVLINEYTSGDGKAFAREVSELGLGKLVGKRSWGGEIRHSLDNQLIDGGTSFDSMANLFYNDFEWGLEISIMPDFEVDNNPKSAFIGEDDQLEKAILVLKEWIEQEPVSYPEAGELKPMKKPEAEKCLNANG